MARHVTSYPHLSRVPLISSSPPEPTFISNLRPHHLQHKLNLFNPLASLTLLELLYAFVELLELLGPLTVSLPKCAPRVCCPVYPHCVFPASSLSKVTSVTVAASCPVHVYTY